VANYHPGDAPEDSDFTGLQVASLTAFGAPTVALISGAMYATTSEIDVPTVYESEDLYSEAVGDVFVDASDVLGDVAVDASADIAEEVFFDALMFLLL
jgi:hypothetical protein